METNTTIRVSIAEFASTTINQGVFQRFVPCCFSLQYRRDMSRESDVIIWRPRATILGSRLVIIRARLFCNLESYIIVGGSSRSNF